MAPHWSNVPRRSPAIFHPLQSARPVERVVLKRQFNHSPLGHAGFESAYPSAPAKPAKNTGDQETALNKQVRRSGEKPAGENKRSPFSATSSQERPPKPRAKSGALWRLHRAGEISAGMNWRCAQSAANRPQLRRFPDNRQNNRDVREIQSKIGIGLRVCAEIAGTYLDFIEFWNREFPWR